MCRGQRQSPESERERERALQRSRAVRPASWLWDGGITVAERDTLCLNAASFIGTAYYRRNAKSRNKLQYVRGERVSRSRSARERTYRQRSRHTAGLSSLRALSLSASRHSVCDSSGPDICKRRGGIRLRRSPRSEECPLDRASRPRALLAQHGGDGRENSRRRVLVLLQTALAPSAPHGRAATGSARDAMA